LETETSLKYMVGIYADADVEDDDVFLLRRV